MNFKNFIKAAKHPNALWAFQKHLITLDEIQTPTFDAELDLSTEMLNAKQNSKNNNDNDFDCLIDDNDSEEEEMEEEIVSDADSDDSSHTKLTKVR